MANVDNLIEALKIEHGVISKELTRFRPCHPETRCYFCREWAQYVYKKHVTSSQKTQDGQQQQPVVLKAGRYRLRFASNASNADDHKVNARALLHAIKKKVDQDDASSTNTSTTTPSNSNGKTQQQQQQQQQQQSLTEEIIAACNAWIEAPSSLATLSSLYEPVQFDPYDEALFEEEDPKDPARLLDPLVVKRQHVYLPSKEFRLLKNLTGDVLLSHKEAMCDHTRPEWKSPSDLDVDRDIFNEKMAIEIQKALGQLEQALNKSWQPLTEFMAQLRLIDKERVRLIGKDECQKDIDYFASKQDITAFADYWTPLAANFKKKQRTPVDLATVDAAFNDYFQGLLAKAEQFHSEFALPRLVAVCALLKNLWGLVMPTIRRMAERMASFEHKDVATHKKNCEALAKSIEKLQPITDVQLAVESIEKETDTRIKEYAAEIEALKKAYEEGKPNVTMRLDKIANNKAFKKLMKKAEGGYHSIRQHFRYQLTQKIFPEQMFSKFCLVCIEALMQEGELMEAVTIEKEIKRFTVEQEEMVEERQYLFEDFEDGVITGRRELAGILGRLFLKEGMRIQGENLAMQRQYTLLQSLSGNGKDAAAAAAAIAAQKAAKQQEGSGGKKKKGRGKNGAANSSGEVKQDGLLASERLEMLNKLCGAVLDEKTSGSASDSTSNNSSKSSSAVPSPAPKKATIQQQQSTTATKSKTTSSAASTPALKAASPTPPSKPVATPSSKPTTPTPAAATTTPSPQKSRSPSPPKPKVVEPKPELKKASSPSPPTVTSVAASTATAAPAKPKASTTATPSPPQQQQQQQSKPASPPKPSTALGPAPVQPSQDLGGWGAVNAAEMVKGWNISKDPVSASDKKSAQPTASKSKQRPQIVANVREQPVVEEKDSGWGVPPAPTGNTEVDAWSTENTAIWTRSKEKRENDTGSTTTNIPTASEQSRKPVTPTSTPSKPSTPTNDGWNEVASKKKPQQQLVVTPASPATDGWGTPNSQNTNDASGWGSQESMKPSAATATVNGEWGVQESAKPTAVNDGWGSQETNKPATTAANADNGWGSQEEATNQGWGATVKQADNSGWGAEVKQTSNDGWGASSKKSANDSGWGTQETKPASTPQRQTTSDGGWGASQKQTVDDGGWGVGADDGWKTQGSNGWGSKEKKTSTSNNSNRRSTGYSNSNNSNYSNRDCQQQQQQQQKPVDKWSSAGNAGWGNTAGWNTRDEQSDNQQPKSIPGNGWDNDNSNQHWQQQQQRGSARTSGTATPTEQQQQPNEVVNFSLKDILQQSTSTQPPGLASPAVAAPVAATPAHLQPQSVMANSTATFTATTSSPAPGHTASAASATAATLATSSLIMQQQQEVVPAEQIRAMSHDSLVNFVQNLQRDNTRLLQTLIGAQQEMSMQTSRYAELMSLSRERETQMLELFEARKQTEMEEARRYVLSLEARISTLEGQLQTATAAAAASSSSGNGNNHHHRERGGSMGGATAGFGNQDLFAGYREEMRSNHRGRRYNKNTVVRCGNCGGSGHTSAQCQDVCRYCGSQDHLSETCSMNQ